MSILLKSLTSCRKRQSWGDGESLAALGVGDSARKIPNWLSLSCFGDSRALLPVWHALSRSFLLCPSLLLSLLSLN